MIKIDMNIAKEIKKQEIRYERFNKFKNLDIEFIKALEQNDEILKESIKEKKQKLRDATSDTNIELATNLDELRTIRPSILDEV